MHEYIYRDADEMGVFSPKIQKLPIPSIFEEPLKFIKHGHIFRILYGDMKSNRYRHA